MSHQVKSIDYASRFQCFFLFVLCKSVIFAFFIARNISNWGRADLNRSKRIARTEGHRVQCKADLNCAYRARQMGCDTVKQWNATLDGKTRDSHAAIDKEWKELEEPFSNGLMYPGDPKGKAAEVINCRCSLDDVPRWYAQQGGYRFRRDNETGEIIECKNYAEFKEKYLNDPDRLNKIRWNKVATKTDKEQFARYKSIIGKNAPKTLDEFCKIKYNKDEWNLFKAYYNSIKSGELTSLADFKLYKTISEQINNEIIGLTTSNGIKITGKSNHAIARIIGSVEQKRSGVQVTDILSALRSDKSEILPIRKRKNGRSQKFRNGNVEVSINPDTGNIIQVNPKHITKGAKHDY